MFKYFIALHRIRSDLMTPMQYVNESLFPWTCIQLAWFGFWETVASPWQKHLSIFGQMCDVCRCRPWWHGAIDLDCVDILLRGGVMWSDWEERQAGSRLRSFSSLRCPCAPSPVRKKEKAPSGGLPLPQARQLRSEGNSFGFLPRLFHLACQGKSKPLSLSLSPLYLFLLSTLSILSDIFKPYLLMCLSELLMEMYQIHK